MRHGWLLVIGLWGCLYIGGINHAPKGEIIVGTQQPKTGEWVVLTADVTDSDGEELRYAWSLEIQTADGKTVTASLGELDDLGPGGGAGADAGVGPQSLLLPDGDAPDRVKVWTRHRGSYTVRLEVLDERGAGLDLEAAFQVANQAPALALRWDVETQYKLTDRVPDAEVTGGAAHNPAHAHYLVRLDETGSSDHEEDLVCGGKATISYELLQPEMALTDYWETVSCQPGEMLDRKRFRLDAAKTGAKQTVKIRVTVDDGYGGVTSEEIDLDVVPNRPACIVKGKLNEGTFPPMPPPDGGSLKVPVIAADGLTFEVRFPNDDVDEGFRYTWLAREAGGEFEVLEQGPESALELGPWFRMPGQEVELRVVIGDRYQDGLPACTAQTVLCREDPTILPDDCYQWVTWQLEFY